MFSHVLRNKNMRSSRKPGIGIPSEVSVCGVHPSERLKVPLSVQDTSDTSVSDTDNSLAATVRLICGNRNMVAHFKRQRTFPWKVYT